MQFSIVVKSEGNNLKTFSYPDPRSVKIICSLFGLDGISTTEALFYWLRNIEKALVEADQVDPLRVAIRNVMQSSPIGLGS